MAKVLVIGRRPRPRLETVSSALRAGHSVRAPARSAATMAIRDAALGKVSRDALDRNTVQNAIQDVNAVIQTLGVHFSPRVIFAGTTLFSERPRASWSMP